MELKVKEAFYRTYLDRQVDSIDQRSDCTFLAALFQSIPCTEASLKMKAQG